MNIDRSDRLEGKSQKAIKETDGELKKIAPEKGPFQSSDPVKVASNCSHFH